MIIQENLLCEKITMFTTKHILYYRTLRWMKYEDFIITPFFFKTVYFGQIEQHTLEYLSVYRYKTEIYRTTKKFWYMSKFWALLPWKYK